MRWLCWAWTSKKEAEEEENWGGRHGGRDSRQMNKVEVVIEESRLCRWWVRGICYRWERGIANEEEFKLRHGHERGICRGQRRIKAEEELRLYCKLERHSLWTRQRRGVRCRWGIHRKRARIKVRKRRSSRMKVDDENEARTRKNWGFVANRE